MIMELLENTCMQIYNYYRLIIGCDSMKNIKVMLLVFLLILLLPFMINAKECEKNSIKLESILLKEKTDYEEEKSPAKAKNNTINIDLKMYEPGDFVEYKLKVKNTSNEDFYFDKSFIDLESDYLDYVLSYGDNTNLVQAQTEKEVLLRIQYKKEIPKSAYESQKYTDKSSFNINLTNKDTMINPKTGTKIFILFIMIILIIIGITRILIEKNKKVNILLLIKRVLLVIPISVFAVCMNEIKVNLDVDFMEYLANPNYLYASSNHLLTPSGKLYYYDINRLNYNEEISATLDNLNAQEVATDVKHFDEYNNYYFTNDNKIYTLNNSELLLDNIKDLYNIGPPYAITKDNKLYRIEKGEVTFISDNVNYVYNNGSLSDYCIIDLNGNIYHYTRVNSNDDNYDVLDKTIFENSNGDDITGINMSYSYITIKINNNDYYIYYLNDSDNLGLIKLNDLKYILKKENYFVNLAIKKKWECN